MEKSEMVAKANEIALNIITGIDITPYQGQQAYKCTHSKSNKITIVLNPEGSVYCTQCDEALFSGTPQEAKDFIMLIEAWILLIAESPLDLPVQPSGNPFEQMITVSEAAGRIELSFNEDKESLRNILDGYLKDIQNKYN